MPRVAAGPQPHHAGDVERGRHHTADEEEGFELPAEDERAGGGCSRHGLAEELFGDGQGGVLGAGVGGLGKGHCKAPGNRE